MKRNWSLLFLMIFGMLLQNFTVPDKKGLPPWFVFRLPKIIDKLRGQKGFVWLG